VAAAMDPAALLLVLVPLFVIVDPFASIGLFLGLTTGHSRRERMTIAGKASLFAAAVLVLFAAAGRVLLEYLGIELHALQAAGGVLLLIIGLRMLREGREIPRRELQLPTGGGYDPDGPDDPSFVPLGLPMLAGPGAISLVIVQTTNQGLGLVALAIVATMLGAALLLMAAARMQRILGHNGSRIITRIMGILTVAFAMQYVFDGVGGWLREQGML
jgi:multiple antibiotic resistance protein